MKVVSASVLVYQGDMDELVSHQYHWCDIHRGMYNIRAWGGVSGLWEALDAVFEGEGGAAE